MQFSETFRCWRPKIFVHVSYNGGLGVTEPKQYSYYIQNTYEMGLAYPFQWKGAWLSAVLDCKYLPYKKPSLDPIYTLYWWKGFFNYKLECSGDFSIWTENRNHGDDPTSLSKGKKCSFYAEPQVWYSLVKNGSIGSKLNIYYHVLSETNMFQFYPTLAIKYKFP